jgi:hypothetical protein
MSDLWSTELTPEEEEDLLQKAAGEIRKRKMETAAILALEAHKPLANVIAHGTIAFSGFLVPILGFQNVNDYSRLLRKKENVERLIRLLEQNQKGFDGSAANIDSEARQS